MFFTFVAGSVVINLKGEMITFKNLYLKLINPTWLINHSESEGPSCQVGTKEECWRGAFPFSAFYLTLSEHPVLDQLDDYRKLASARPVQTVVDYWYAVLHATLCPFLIIQSEIWRLNSASEVMCGNAPSIIFMNGKENRGLSSAEMRRQMINELKKSKEADNIVVNAPSAAAQQLQV